MLVQVLSKRFDLLSPYIDAHNCAFILMQEGVYLLPQLSNKIASENLFVLDTDLAASGLASQELLDENCFKIVNAQQWVALCVEHHSIVTVQE